MKAAILIFVIWIACFIALLIDAVVKYIKNKRIKYAEDKRRKN